MLIQARLAWALGLYCEMVRLNNADCPSNNHHRCRHQKGFAKTHCHWNWLLLLIGVNIGFVCIVGLIHVFSSRRRLEIDQAWIARSGKLKQTTLQVAFQPALSHVTAGNYPILPSEMRLFDPLAATTVNLFLSGYIFGAAEHDSTSVMTYFGNVALMRFRNFHCSIFQN